MWARDGDGTRPGPRVSRRGGWLVASSHLVLAGHVACSSSPPAPVPNTQRLQARATLRARPRVPPASGRRGWPWEPSGRRLPWTVRCPLPQLLGAAAPRAEAAGYGDGVLRARPRPRPGLCRRPLESRDLPGRDGAMARGRAPVPDGPEPADPDRPRASPVRIWASPCTIFGQYSEAEGELRFAISLDPRMERRVLQPGTGPRRHRAPGRRPGRLPARPGHRRPQTPFGEAAAEQLRGLGDGG